MFVQPLLGGSSVLAVVALDVQTLDMNILDVFLQIDGACGQWSRYTGYSSGVGNLKNDG